MNGSWGPFVDCLISSEIQVTGIGYVIIAREKNPQAIRCVSFVVDVFCLGVKDCMYKKCSHSEYVFLKENLSTASQLVTIVPSYAKKLIEGAVTYAKELGFNPHPDFQYYFESLKDIDSSECNDTFSFGKDGKPFYIQGPNDSTNKVARILTKLGEKLGTEGFNYMVEA